jgi:hypothetical protein
MRIIALATAAALAMPMAPAFAQQTGTVIGQTGPADFPFEVQVDGQTLFCDGNTGQVNCVSPDAIANAGTGAGEGFFAGGGLTPGVTLLAGGAIIGVIIAATGSATNNTN